MIYIVLALLFAIYQLGIVKVYFIIFFIRWGKFLSELIACYLCNDLNPDESQDIQSQEAILTIGSLPDNNPAAKDKKLEAPEPVSEPKDTPTEVTRRPGTSPSNEQLETDEKWPACLYPEIIVLTDEPVSQQSCSSRLLTEREIADETTGLSELMAPDEQEEDDEDEGDNWVLVPKNSEVTNEEMDNISPDAQDLLTENRHPIEIDNTPKHIEIRVLKGVNFPGAKETDQYYLSMRVEEWRCQICDQDQKVKSKTVRGSQPGWNKDFTIKTQNPEGCLMTLKVKKSSRLGLKTSTVGFVKLYVSSLFDGLTELQLYGEDYNPVGDAFLEVETKIEDLPKVIPSPAEDKRKQRKMKAKMIFSQRLRIKYTAMKIAEIVDGE